MRGSFSPDDYRSESPSGPLAPVRRGEGKQLQDLALNGPTGHSDTV
jgi:hypothetical protein